MLPLNGQIIPPTKRRASLPPDFQLKPLQAMLNYTQLSVGCLTLRRRESDSPHWHGVKSLETHSALGRAPSFNIVHFIAA